MRLIKALVVMTGLTSIYMSLLVWNLLHLNMWGWGALTFLTIIGIVIVLVEED